MKHTFEVESENGAQAWRVELFYNKQAMIDYFKNARNLNGKFRQASATGEPQSGTRCRGGIEFRITPIEPL